MFENGFGWDAISSQMPAGSVKGEKKSYVDERFWKISKDEQGNGLAVIRLMLDPKGKPLTRVYHHSLKFRGKDGKERFYIQDSPGTINLPCPVTEEWSRLWNEGTQESKDNAKFFSRKVKYIANIMVVKDPANPENNGKIFLWEFGTKLMDKFEAAMKPTEQMLELGEEPKELFNPMSKGCNIKLVIKKAAGFFNYDSTEILAPSSICETSDEAKQIITGKCFDLSEFNSPEHFLSYEELTQKLAFARTGIKGGVSQPSVTQEAMTQVAPKAPQKVEEVKEEDAPWNTPAVKEAVSADDDLAFLDDM